MIELNQKINLKELEKKAWTTYFQDGLWDIFFGIMLLTMVIRTITDNVWFTFLMFLGVFFMIAGKRYITTPRIGLVKFGTARMMKRIKLLGIIGLTVIITSCLLWPNAFFKDLPTIVSSILVASMVITIFCAMAYYLDYFPLAIYGLLFGIGEILWSLFGESVGLMAMLVFGSFIFILGLIMLGQFLRKYPLPTEEVANGI